MKNTVVAVILLAIGSNCFADTLDVAEAKKRGVAVEVVELEHAGGEEFWRVGRFSKGFGGCF